MHVAEGVRDAGALRKLGVVKEVDEEVSAGLARDACVRAITYDASLEYCGVVLGAGVAMLLSLRRRGGAPPCAVDGRWLRDGMAASIAIEPRRMLASVGLADGDVEQYYIGVPAGDVCPVMRRLSLSSWYFDPKDVGAASVVSWTRDGGALLVGWARRGLAVWSVSGCRLMWTLPQVGGVLPSTPGAKVGERGVRGRAAFNHPMEEGVLSAAWGPEGLCLWAAPRATGDASAVVRDCHFMEFSFFRSTTGATSCQSEASRLAMFSGDRVLLLASSDGFVPRCAPARRVREPRQERLGGKMDTEFAWQHLLIPHDYLWHNWPPTRIAVNDDASYVAVAGQYGVGICAVRSQRWRVFGDVSYDARRIKCCALAWVGPLIVVGNEVEPTGGRPAAFELLVFPRDQIERSAVQVRRSLPTRPVIIDVRADGYLLIICEDSSVILYRVQVPDGVGSIGMTVVYHLYLPTRETRLPPVDDAAADVGGSALPPSPGGGISTARIFPPLDHAFVDGEGGGDTEAPVPTQIMLLRSTGSLIMLDVKQMLSIPLLRYVEHFWYTSASDPPFDSVSNRPIWWAYGDDGTHVCFREGMRRFLPRGKDARTDGKLGDVFSGALDVEGAERLARMSPLAKTGSGGARISASPKGSGIGVEQWFELDPEVYPLGIMSRQGMLLGASQGLLANSVAMDRFEMPSHVIQVKRQPVLHTLLRHLLMKPVSDDRLALQIALKCSNQPQFVDSLEWLLYEAVMEYDEDDFSVGEGTASRRLSLNAHRGSMTSMDKKSLLGRVGEVAGASVDGFPASPRRTNAGSRLFPRVIRLLKYFGQYEDIVVRCARKMDSKRWPLLFSHAGDPVALLDKCFASDRLRTAACLLVILQEMWGFASSTPQSLRLVSAALEKGEIGLAGDLANFLGKASRAGMLEPSQLTTREDVSWIASAAAARYGSRHGRTSASGTPVLAAREMSFESDSGSRIPAVDAAVWKHANVLLRKMEVRKLAALSVRMDFPLAAWLTREVAARTKDGDTEAIFVEDFSFALLSLHRQFQYPEPSIRAVRRAIEGLSVTGLKRSPSTVSRGSRGSRGSAASLPDMALGEVGKAPPKSPGSARASGSAGDVVAARSPRSNGSARRRPNGVSTEPDDADGVGLNWRESVRSPRQFLAKAQMQMTGSYGDFIVGAPLPPPPSSNESCALSGMRAKARHLCQQELVYLLAVSESAAAPDLSALFGVLLLDVGAVVHEILPRPALRERVLRALRGFGVQGYDAMADALEAYVEDA